MAKLYIRYLCGEADYQGKGLEPPDRGFLPRLGTPPCHIEGNLRTTTISLLDLRWDLITT